MTVVITPVGTSLFTNGGENNTIISDFFADIKDLRNSDWQLYIEVINRLRTETTQFISSTGITACAELQSTAKIQDALDNEIRVHLLASDTIASRLAAEILKDQINLPNSVLGPLVTAIFNPNPAIGKIDVIRDLQVKNAKEFSREGMPNLFHRIHDIMKWEAFDSGNLAINITGGYGATLPYLTIFAQLESVPLYYNFEDSNELIEIPQAPLTIDWDLIKHYSNVLEQIDAGIETSDWREFKKTNYQAVKELDAFIWWDESAGACLSPIGVIFWEQYLKSHFVLELAEGVENNSILKRMVQELYRRLNSVLSPNVFTSPKCYKTIRDLGDQDDLNHTGPIHGHDIFIFKWTADAQRRLMYSFEVNGRAITRIKIYDRRDEHMETNQYGEWKNQIIRTHPQIVFTTHTL